MMYGRFFRSGRTAAAILTAAILITSGGAAAQGFFTQSGTLVRTDAAASLSVFHPGSTGYIAVTAMIQDGWHINSNAPLDRFLIPSVLEIKGPEGLEILDILYPEPEMAKLEVSDSEMSLYHGRVVIGAIVRMSGEMSPGDYTISCTLSYQGCNDLTCLEPASSTSKLTVRVGSFEETAEAVNQEIFSTPPFVDGEGVPVLASGRVEAGSFGDTVEEKGLFLTFLLVFLGGLALNLTPCIYPLIPITVSYFGAQSDGRTSRTFLLTLVYVLGMSITYSALGIIAAMTGSLFGSALQNPWVVLFIVAVLIGLSTSMFGLWELRMPTFLMKRTGTARQGGWGALFMGLTVGIVAAPCIGPFVLGLLTWVGEMGKPVLGFFMFFTLAWGMGIPFIVLGTISGSITRLPRSGNWMIWVKKIFGFILLLMGLYFARQLLNPVVVSIGYIIVLIVGAIFLGWIDKVPGMGRGFGVLRKTIALIMLASAIVLAVMPGGPFRKMETRPGIEWQDWSADLLTEATTSGRPVMIDFSADWCIPCHELELLTFTDTEVLELSRGFTSLKVDLTRSGETEKALKERFNVRGVPTIVFFDANGEEVPGARITGFVGPEVMLEKMRSATGSGGR